MEQNEELTLDRGGGSEAIPAAPGASAPAGGTGAGGGNAAVPADRPVPAPGESPENGGEARPGGGWSEGAVYAHFARLQAQSAALRESVPGFRLERELADPVFARLTAPGSGIGVEAAYYAVHHRELQDAALRSGAETVRRRLTNAVQANAARPAENGGDGPGVLRVDYRTMTRSQREELHRRIHAAASRGEKLYPRDIWG